MSAGNLSFLQGRVLRLLCGFAPSWTLTGGAALVGFYTRHRTTRDIDLFLRGANSLGEARQVVVDGLRFSGLTVDAIQTAPAFARLRVSDGKETVVLDLVADPVPPVEPPVQVEWEGTHVQIDTPHEIFVDKLCALLGRAELRDLQDIQVLLEAGHDLMRGLTDAPSRDGGFSPLTLAWVLRGLPVKDLGHAIGWPVDQVEKTQRFRDGLVNRILDLIGEETTPP